MIYLLHFSFQGIKNIEQPLYLSFYKKTIQNDFLPENYKIQAIYGENGSGKTAIVTAVKILRELIINRNYLLNFDKQNELIELVNKKTKSGFLEAEFYVGFGEDANLLHYKLKFKVNDDNRFSISSETFEMKSGSNSRNHYKTIYETKNGDLLKYGNNLSDYTLVREKTLNLLNQQTLVPLIFETDINLIDGNSIFAMTLLYYCGSSIFACIDNEDSHIQYVVNQQFEKLQKKGITDNFYRFKDLRSAELFGNSHGNIVSKKNFGAFKKQVDRLFRFVQIFKPDLINIDIDKKIDGENYICNLVMVYPDYLLDSEFESRGIRKIMQLFKYLENAVNGAIVFIDELDSNINDIYLEKLIEYFMNYGKGQLCFTAHNLSPMNILKDRKKSICFISSTNTVHLWTSDGNLSPENAYRNGFIDDSPFNVEASDFLGN